MAASSRETPINQQHISVLTVTEGARLLRVPYDKQHIQRLVFSFKLLKKLRH